MIPRRRRVPREEFSSLLRSIPARVIGGNWYTAHIYPPAPNRQGKISVIISSKIASGVKRNIIRRRIYDAIGSLAPSYGVVLFFVKTNPSSAQELSAAITKISQEIRKLL